MKMGIYKYNLYKYMDTETLGIGMAILGILIMQTNLWFSLRRLWKNNDAVWEHFDDLIDELWEEVESLDKGQKEFNKLLVEDVMALQIKSVPQVKKNKVKPLHK